MNVMVKVLELLAHTRKVPGYKISVQSLAIRSEIFRNFSKSLQENYPKYLKLCSNHFLPYPFQFTILQFDAIQAELLTVSSWEPKQ